jgi:hypothetical protein
VSFAQRPKVTKNKVENSGKFSTAEKWSSRDHVYHAIHHKFTTKNHPLAPQNPQNPL